MQKDTPFKFPNKLVNQIDEFSDGFFLVVINTEGEFEVFQTLDSPVKSMAMHNFLQIYTNNINAAMQDTMGQSANPPTGNEDGQDDQDDKD